MAISLSKPSRHLKNEIEKITTTIAKLESHEVNSSTSTESVPTATFEDGWDDLISPIALSKKTGVNIPTWVPFGPDGVIEQYAFANNDAVIIVFHTPHDIKPNSNAYIHMHWSTNGTDTGVVGWEFFITLAKGHDQEAFGNTQQITVQQNASGTPWKHMVTEAQDPNVIFFEEPDALILVKVKRMSAGVDTCTDTVFGLSVDIHYQVDRLATPNRSPNFYS